MSFWVIDLGLIVLSLRSESKQISSETGVSILIWNPIAGSLEELKIDSCMYLALYSLFL